MSPSAREYLQHILDETTYIITTTKNLDKAQFSQDETLKCACVRSIEIIGSEAYHYESRRAGQMGFIQVGRCQLCPT